MAMAVTRRQEEAGMIKRNTGWVVAMCLGLAAGCATSPTSTPQAMAGHTYHVDGVATNAADTNAGTAAQPWKTIARAGSAKELKPGDTVLIHSGVYREHAKITVSGAPGRPITFAAAPGAKVVIKGSEIVKGPWERLADAREVNVAPNVPRASVWRVKLGEEFFTDKDFPGCYDNTSKRWVSQVFWQDSHPLQMIGPDGVYKNDDSERLIRMQNIGKGLDDMIPQSFFFDPPSGYLYIYIGGDPGWYVIEVGVRGFLLTCSQAHDVIIRGFEARHNRQPGGQWPAVTIGQCERVVMEACRVEWADFTGLGFGSSTNCTIRRCDFSNNGCTGMGMGMTEDCVVEDCSLMRNDYRKFYGTWGVAAGSKNIPGNRRATFRRCEFAYNDGPGLWFDTDNSDIRILDNVMHHNTDCGIFFEINRKGGGLIAGNLVYANGGRGIYVAGSEHTTVAHNTVVENDCGIVFMPYNDPNGTTAGSTCLNNLLIRNYVAGPTIARGCDLTLDMRAGPAWQASHHSRSDFNVYAANAWTPTMRPNWNDDYPLARWQQDFGMDVHSRLAPVDYRRVADGFELLTVDGLPPAGPMPEAVAEIWKPANPRRVGANLTRWPAELGPACRR
jgi:parallel beta-helix repeat protein